MSAEGARVGMNDRTREDDVTEPPGQLIPPACPAQRPAPESLLPGSTYLFAELGKAGEGGASGRRRVALDTHSPLLFLYGLKGAGELAGGRRRDSPGPARAPSSQPSLAFSPTTTPRTAGRRMLELGHTPGSPA